LSWGGTPAPGREADEKAEADARPPLIVSDVTAAVRGTVWCNRPPAGVR
jgi:hypothetical protein